MPNYSTSKIYEIICRITNERYIGSTTEKLSRRLAGHRTLKCSSKRIIERGDYYINLIEEYPACQNKEQLLKREREWYDKLECINKCRPIRSKEEKVEYKKQYNTEHAEELRAYQQANKDRRNQVQRERRARNKLAKLEQL